MRTHHPVRRSTRLASCGSIALIGAIAALAIAAPASFAATGSVYWDTNGNAAAGEPCSTEPSPAPATSGSAGT